MWTTRLKGNNLKEYVQYLLEQAETENYKFFDPEIAGGQFVAVAENLVGAENVSGLSDNAMDINYGKSRLGLNGNYSVGNFLEDDVIDLKGHIAIGNPPYNDDSVGRNPIYDKFLGKLVQSKPDQIVFIIPTNWFPQTHTKLGQDVRKHLKALGVYKIIVNPEDLFEGVKVGTCSVFCKLGYTGTIDLVNHTDIENKIVIKDFDDQILTVFNPVELALLKRLKPETHYTTRPGAKEHPNKWRIATSYRKENFDVEPLNTVRVMEPNYKSQKGYRVFATFETKDEAEKHVEYYKSFWHSKLIKFIMRRTRTSTTLDNPQLRWIPKVDKFDRIFTDEELYKLFNLSQEEILLVEKDNPFG